MLSPAHGPAIAAAFGLGDAATLTGPVARGEQGQVWRLDTERGAFAVKDPFIEMSAADALADADYQDAVRAAGVPMPEPLRTPDGRVLVEVAGAPARVYRWVDVLTKQRRLDPAGSARLLAAIHARGGAHGRGRWTRGTSSRSAPTAGGRSCSGSHDGAGAVRGRPRVAAAGRAGGRDAAGAAPGHPVCHLDLWSDNLRRTPDGGLVVLDWENSGPGDPSQELGCVRLRVRRRGPRADRAPSTRRTSTPAGPGGLERPADFTVLVAQLGHITEVGCARWLASTTEGERRHNEGWVREFVDDPVTVEKIERILAAVSSPRRS